MSAHVLGPPLKLTGLVTAVNPVSSGIVIAGSPLLGFSGTNFDGANNGTLIDSQALGTWVNLGSLGTTNNAVQATAGNKPAFKLAAPNGKSAAQCVDVNRFMTTAAFTLIAQPYVVAVVHRNDMTTTQVYLGATAPLTELYSTTTVDHLNFGTDTSTALTPTANQFHLRVAVANGANSFLRIDGVQSANINFGSQGFGTVVTLMRDPTGSLGIIGYAQEFWVWSGTPGSTAPSIAAIESMFTTYYGSFPQ